MQKLSVSLCKYCLFLQRKELTRDESKSLALKCIEHLQQREQTNISLGTALRATQRPAISSHEIVGQIHFRIRNSSHGMTRPANLFAVYSGDRLRNKD